MPGPTRRSPVPGDGGRGADLIDIGGESTRPGAQEVPVAVEIARVRPVIEALASEATGVPISLDTRKAAVAEAGLRGGADILNDVSGLRFDPALADVAAGVGAPLILMHSIGTPETMQALAAAGAYDDVLLDVYDGSRPPSRRPRPRAWPRARIVVDPGIGFGKTDDQNRALMSRIGLFHGLGCRSCWARRARGSWGAWAMCRTRRSGARGRRGWRSGRCRRAFKSSGSMI
jgi:dihydropteroate synthase